jgi:type I restriction enzyme S subunit
MTPALVPPKASAVWFKELERWDPGSFQRITWKWPKSIMQPIGSFLRPRKERVDRAKHHFADLQPITIHFDGSIDRRAVDGNREYTMDLFFARPGDVVVAKIDLKNGAVGIVPDWKSVAVTGHFAVYEPDRSKVVPEYFHRVIQTSFFREHLWRNKVGAEGRKEVKLAFLEAQVVPLPPLPVQEAIVEHWRKAHEAAAKSRDSVAALEAEIPLEIYKALGTPHPNADSALPKLLVLWWNQLERWSFNYIARACKGLLGFTRSRYPIRPLGEHLLDTTNGYCIKPIQTQTPHKMLKLSALTPAGLDAREAKFVKVSDRIAQRFHLRKGDLLICRSVGSYGYVAKCALVEEDRPDLLFPDIIIRARFAETILPEFAREVIQTPLGRSHFQSNARTAVGMWKIGAEDIRNFPIPVPPLEVQREIVDTVSRLRARIAEERRAAEERQAQAAREVEEMILGVRTAG